MSEPAERAAAPTDSRQSASSNTPIPVRVRPREQTEAPAVTLETITPAAGPASFDSLLAALVSSGSV